MRWFTPIFVIPVLLLCSCSGSTSGINTGGKVTGKVTIDGKPVTAGNIVFYSADDQYSVMGPINEYGVYTVKEPPLGKCSIEVITSNMRGSVRPKKGGERENVKQENASRGMVLPNPDEIGMTYVETPAKYENRKTSGLSYEVKKGDQEHDLTLTK